MRIFSVSDVHSDFTENKAWLDHLVASGEHGKDVLIVAGDVSERITTFRRTMEAFKSAFAHVFFVPGNHDLWVEDEAGLKDSLTKLGKLQEICKSLGVHTSPKLIDNVWIVPLLSWYHTSFDREPEVTCIKLPSVERMASDYRRCVFAEHLEHGSEDLAHYIDSLNGGLEAAIKREEGQRMITFSHFLPRQDLLPEKRFLFYPHLPKMSGSQFLYNRILALQPDVHVFGHTHIGWDMVCEEDGVRYIQGPLAYPGERSSGMNGGPSFTPFLIYRDDAEDADPGFAPVQECYWSKVYKERPRDPSNVVDLAPYVLARWK